VLWKISSSQGRILPPILRYGDTPPSFAETFMAQPPPSDTKLGVRVETSGPESVIGFTMSALQEAVSTQEARIWSRLNLNDVPETCAGNQTAAEPWVQQSRDLLQRPRCGRFSSPADTLPKSAAEEPIAEGGRPGLIQRSVPLSELIKPCSDRLIALSMLLA
jgi:hypothetical protein